MDARTQETEAQRWKCVCAYDGAAFAGWQSQQGGGSLQDVIEARLAQLLGVPTRIHASGRTDAGVHARGQVFHFDGAWRHGPEKLLAAFRSGLPPGIQVSRAQVVPKSFHARFSATGKQYRYQLHLGDADPFLRPYVWIQWKTLDFSAMELVAAELRGEHDFRAFSAFNGVERKDTVRDLRRLDIQRKGALVTIVAEADGFLYKMVRSLVGALVVAGEGKLGPEKVRSLLQSRQRQPLIATAPAQGLFLQRVYYGKTVKPIESSSDEDDAE